MSDEYTLAMRMCDDEGLVSSERIDEERNRPLLEPVPTYLERLNFLRALGKSARGEQVETISEPFACTGHAHLANEHIRCTSPYHDRIKFLGVSLVSDPLPEMRTYAIAASTVWMCSYEYGECQEIFSTKERAEAWCAKHLGYDAWITAKTLDPQ